MIFWMTVVSFMVAIMTALIYPREDRVRVQDIPISEAAVSTFVAQHQAARDYANALVPAFHHINTAKADEADAPPAVYISETSYKTKAQYVHVFREDFDIGYMPVNLPYDGHRGVSYQLFPNQTGSDKDKDGDLIKDPATGMTTTPNASYGYTSAVICMNAVDDDEDDNGVWEDEVKNSKGEHVSGDSYGEIIPCNSQIEKTETFRDTLDPEITNEITHTVPAFKYVVTYGLLFPNETNEPNVYKNTNILWERALLNRTKNNPDCGYVEAENENDPRIMALNGKRRHIPRDIYKLYKKYLEVHRAEQPIMCITPVKTPYEVQNLKYHFDAFLNAKGHPLDRFNNVIEYSPILPYHYRYANSWLNIAKYEDGEYIQLKGSTDKLTEWAKNSGIPLKLDTDGKNGSQRKLAGLNIESVTNEFTLSIVFKPTNLLSADQILFTTSAGGDHIISGKINDGKLVISVKQNGATSTEIGTLTYALSTDKTVSLTYTINSQGHQLYENDTQTPLNQDFAKRISDLGISYLHFFGDDTDTGKLNADIYAIRFYDTKIDKLFIRRNALSDKKRFKF